MRCDEALERMQERLDGALAAERVPDLDAHLASCAPCASEDAALRRLRDALRALPSPAAPAGLRAAVMSRIGAEAVPASGVAAGAARGGRILRMEPRLFAGLAAAAVLLVAVGVTLLPPIGGTGGGAEVARVAHLEHDAPREEAEAQRAMDDLVAKAAAPGNERSKSKDGGVGGDEATASENAAVPEEKGVGVLLDGVRGEWGDEKGDKRAADAGAAPPGAKPAAPAPPPGSVAAKAPADAVERDASEHEKKDEPASAPSPARRAEPVPSETRRYVVFRSAADAESFLAVVAAQSGGSAADRKLKERARAAAGGGAARPTDAAAASTLRAADLRVRGVTKLADAARAWGGVLGPAVLAPAGAEDDAAAIESLAKSLASEGAATSGGKSQPGRDQKSSRGDAGDASGARLGSADTELAPDVVLRIVVLPPAKPAPRDVR